MSLRIHRSYLLPVLFFVGLVFAESVPGRDWYIHPEVGSDQNDGNQGRPLATAQIAVDRAGKGDRIVLLPEQSIYRQSIVINKGQAGLVIEGNGVTLTGADPLPANEWESLGDDLHRMRLPATSRNRHLLIVNGKAERMGRLCSNPIEFPLAEDLQVGQFRWDAINEKEGWLTFRGDPKNLEWSTRSNGIATSGEVRNIKVFNLGAVHFLNDGFNIHGNARGLQFFNVSGLENFDEGFSAHDTATCWIKNGQFFRNEHAVADVNEADTYYEDCQFGESEAVEVLFKGGRHSMTRCQIKVGPNSVPISIAASNSAERKTESVSASLVLREIRIEASKTNQQRWEVGAGVTVFVDELSSEQLSHLKLDKHPSADISNSLYRIAPIGRSSDGTPIMTWVGGGTGAPRSRSYRIIHFDKHSPQDVASKIAPDNDWFGLMAPLPTGAFPPTGDAFQPENRAAHTIWRWIGLTAPNAVFVPDTPEGKALATALQLHPPAGVGMVDVFMSEEDEKGQIKTSVLSLERRNRATAKSEMIQRLRRGPSEIVTQLTPNYGKRFSGSYIDALALIAKLRCGANINATEMARERVDTSLPRSGGDIAGTLLYAELEEPWATSRLLKVADLAFNEDGSPKEAMPMHNEMSDAIFMAGPVLARAGELSGEKRYLDQCANNVRFIQNLCLREDGIYRHSPLNEAAWGRGNGFPALGIAMILDHFPKDHPDREFLEESVRSHLRALAEFQSSNGMWHQLIDLPDSYEELTSTCMIAYSIVRGIRSGWLDSNEWSPILLLAWEGIKGRISSDGSTLYNVCTGTGKQKTLEDYYNRKAILGPDPRGGAMALLLSAEMINWFDRPNEVAR